MYDSFIYTNKQYGFIYNKKGLIKLIPLHFLEKKTNLFVGSFFCLPNLSQKYVYSKMVFRNGIPKSIPRGYGLFIIPFDGLGIDD